jgi:small multidrug resistance family-3 protein
MGEALLFPLALVLEVCGIFAVWNWSRRLRSIWWLVVGLALVLIVMSLIVMSAHDLPKQAYPGFFGMYLFAALAWAWWFEGLSPIDWKAGEVAIAVF